MNRIEIIQMDQEELKELIIKVLQEEIPKLIEELTKPKEKDTLLTCNH